MEWVESEEVCCANLWFHLAGEGGIHGSVDVGFDVTTFHFHCLGNAALAEVQSWAQIPTHAVHADHHCGCDSRGRAVRMKPVALFNVRTMLDVDSLVEIVRHLWAMGRADSFLRMLPAPRGGPLGEARPEILRHALGAVEWV